MSVKIEGGHYTAQWGMLEPPSFAENDGHVDDILVGRTLVDMQKQTTPLRVMNLSREPKVIRRGAMLACCEPVVSIINPRSSAPLGRITGVSREANLEELPIHLKSLFQCSVDGLATTEKEALHQLLCQFSNLFSADANDLGCTNLVTHEIHTGDAKPIRQPPRRLPLAKREEAEKILSEMKQQEVIEPSASAWSSPIVLVKKKDGSTRFCIDYRKLNEITQKDSYPLPRIDDTIDSLAGAEWFSTLAQTAFSRLKTALIEAHVLSYPDLTLPFILDTDASSVGIGAVLSQVVEGRERPVAYFSTALSQAQHNYCVTRRELLAVVQAVKRFHPYLYGQNFLIRTDHSALQWLLNFRQPEGQTAR